METHNCLVVDDEPIAREIIENYCSHLQNLHVIGSCGNALEAKIILQQQKVDILFLDVNMPIIDGISFLKTLKNPPQVIFTTAYKEYAVNAFDLAACDYLLKPFSLDRFIIAVDKAIEKLHGSTHPVAEVPDTKTDAYIFIKTEGKIFKIQHSDLLFAEAQGNYIKITTTQNVIVPNMTFSKFEEMLPKSIFLRVHRSYIINKSKISHVEGNRIFINNIEIPIGSNFKELFLRELGFSF
jgi:DNA-binding LytR/AlgR family response regulator